MIIYQALINLDSGMNLTRKIIEYNVYDQGDTAYTMSKDGSIGTYVVTHAALDKKQIYSYAGCCFYTKDKSKLKEYCKILDDYMTKYLAEKKKMIEKHEALLETSWVENKPKESKAKNSEKSNEEDI